MLSGAGITTWLNSTPDTAHLALSSFVDDVIELRRVDDEKRLSILKMRSSAHDSEAHAYEIGEGGLRLRDLEPSHRLNGHAVVRPRLALGHTA